jgi:hypothetical protein
VVLRLVKTKVTITLELRPSSSTTRRRWRRAGIASVPHRGPRHSDEPRQPGCSRRRTLFVVGCGARAASGATAIPMRRRPLIIAYRLALRAVANAPRQTTIGIAAHPLLGGIPRPAIAPLAKLFKGPTGPDRDAGEAV